MSRIFLLMTNCEPFRPKSGMQIVLTFFNCILRHPLVMVLSCVVLSTVSRAQEMYVGTAEVDITPKLPVALAGQGHIRIASAVETPLLANIVALESRAGDMPRETAVFVACDLVAIPPAYLEGVRNALGKLLPDFDNRKLIITATHTHTAPVMDTLFAHYPIPPNGVTQPEEFASFFIERVSEGVAKAWKSREKCSVSWGLTHAVVGYNRRSAYFDGTAGMYGATYYPGFAGIEGYEDHDVNTLFFWNAKQKLIATCISVACPAQETENGRGVNADYWHEVRLALKKQFGKQLCVVGWIAAAGDQSPHVMYRYKADQRMHALSGRTRLQEIGRRIAVAVAEAYELVKKDQHNDLPFVHRNELLSLPMRTVTYDEYLSSKKQRDALAAKIASDPKQADSVKVEQFFYNRAVDRYRAQQEGKELVMPVEIHVLRIGDIVVCTNPFELYTEYGIRIQGRSKALQTFVVQLAGESSYLATEKAIKGGGYSATVNSTPVGAEGGQMMVDRTVDLIAAVMETGK